MNPTRSSSHAAPWACLGLLLALGCTGGAGGVPDINRGPDAPAPDNGNGVSGGEGVLGSSRPPATNGNGVSGGEGLLGSSPPPAGDQSGAPKPAGQGGSSGGGGDICEQCGTIVQCSQGEITAAECNSACGKVSASCASCVKGAGSDCGDIFDCLKNCDDEGEGGKGGKGGEGGQGGQGGSGPGKNEQLCERCDALPGTCPDLAEQFTVDTCKSVCQTAKPTCEPCVLEAGSDCDAITQCLASSCF